MTAPHPHRQLVRQGPHLDRLFADGAAATISDERGATLVTIVRHVEPKVASLDTLTVFAVDGEIDVDTAPLLQAALMGALDGHDAVCCDLSHVTFFGAAAANTLFAAYRHAAARERTFLVRGAHGMTELVLTAVDPDGLIAWR